MLRLLPLVLLAGACMRAPDPAGMATAPAEAGSPPQVELTAPADWSVLTLDQPFYLGKWQAPGECVATLSWLGGGGGPDFVVQNVQRWIGEWQSPSGEAVGDYSFVTEQNGAFKMHRIGLTGTLVGVRQVGGGEPRTEWALDGIVVETPRGPLFFKMIGPAAAVQAQGAAAWTMLGALVLN